MTYLRLAGIYRRYSKRLLESSAKKQPRTSRFTTFLQHYRALAHPIASVGWLETHESLRQEIAQRRSVVGPCDQIL
jgi:hypothetical protein